jgi:hypothetical protein
MKHVTPHLLFAALPFLALSTVAATAETTTPRYTRIMFCTTACMDGRCMVTTITRQKAVASTTTLTANSASTLGTSRQSDSFLGLQTVATKSEGQGGRRFYIDCSDVSAM